MPTLQWRPMVPADLPAIDRLAQAIHPDFPEDATIFAERLRLYPRGCWVLAGAGGPQGYAISHPWQAGAPPALNTLLGTLPAQAETYYLHDIALSPTARGGGHGGGIVGLLLGVARQAGAGSLSLVAVNGSVPFWQRQGFMVREDTALTEKLASYGEDARFMMRDSGR